MRKVKNSNGSETSVAEGGWANGLQLGIQDDLPEQMTSENVKGKEEKPWGLQGRERANVRIQSSNVLISQIKKLRLQKGKWLSKKSQSQGWNSGLQSHGIWLFTTPTPKLAKWFKLHEGTSTWTAVERKQCPQMVVKDSQSKGSWTTLITTCGKTKVFNSMESHP